MHLRRGVGVWYIAGMVNAPQSLLRPTACSVCGRPARELWPCPWCGESVPLDPRTRINILRVGMGLVILALGSIGIGADGLPWMSSVSFRVLQGLLVGFLLAWSPRERFPSGESGAGTTITSEMANVTIGCRVSSNAAFAALGAALVGFALQAAGTPFPAPFAPVLARLFPAVAAAMFLLRVPAEAPNAPASGSPRVRALRRFVPDLIAAVLLLPFAVLPAFSPLGLALVLGTFVRRLSRPGVPLGLVAAVFALLLSDPSAFAFGILAASLFPATR